MKDISIKVLCKTLKQSLSFNKVHSIFRAVTESIENKV